MGKEVVEEKVPWVLMIILTVVISLFTIWSFSILGIVGGAWQCAYNMGIVSRATTYMVWPYLLLILIYPLRRRFKISNALATYLWTVGTMCSYTLGFGYHDFPVRFALFQVQDSHRIFTDLWWMPPKNEALAMIAGNAPVNWAHWIPITFVTCLFFISFLLFGSVIVSIFRHAWLDVEMIPFPLTLAGYEIVKMIQSGGEGEAKRLAMPFWIGFILAFIYGIPIFMIRTFPWFPDIYGWRAVCPSGAVPVSETDMIAQVVVGYGGYSKDMILFALALLVPLSISFNVWFWTFTMWILNQVAYMMGYYTGILSMPSWARFCCYRGVPTWDEPFRWGILSAVGGFLALAVMQIFLRRQYLLTTIKAALGKVKPEWEKDEAMSYKYMYIMLVISIILCIISCQLFYIDLLPSLSLIAFSSFATWLAMLMLLGHGAFGEGDCRIYPVWNMRLIWPTPPPEPTTSFVMSHFWSFVGMNTATYGLGQGFFATALNLKMAKLTRTSVKNTFWVGIMAYVVSFITISVTKIWLSNLYGQQVIPSVGWAIMDRGSHCPVYVYSLPSNEVFATYGLAGFIIVAVLSILHARFLWFPLEPVGFIIATCFGGLWSRLWSGFLAAWIVKTIVIRIGGSKLYEEWIPPAVGGFAAGVSITVLLGCIAGIVRFYVPF